MGLSMVKMIESVLHNGDTASDICERIIHKYPEFFLRKSRQRGSRGAAIQQIKGEISSRISYAKTTFDIDTNERPYRYSFSSSENNNGNEEPSIVIDDDVDVGYIYILDTNLYNRYGRSIYKIGTTNDIDKRKLQLDSERGCYEKHVVKYVYIVERPYRVEHGIHCVLDKGRVNPKKEGFYSDYVEDHIKVIESIIEMFKVK